MCQGRETAEARRYGTRCYNDLDRAQTSSNDLRNSAEASPLMKRSISSTSIVWQFSGLRVSYKSSTASLAIGAFLLPTIPFVQSFPWNFISKSLFSHHFRTFCWTRGKVDLVKMYRQVKSLAFFAAAASAACTSVVSEPAVAATPASAAVAVQPYYQCPF